MHGHRVSCFKVVFQIMLYLNTVQSKFAAFIQEESQLTENVADKSIKSNLSFVAFLFL